MRVLHSAIRIIGRRRVLGAIGAACILALIGLVWIGNPAADDNAAVAETGQQAPVAAISPGSMAARIIGSVVLVIAVLYASMYGMKVLSRRAGGGDLKKDAITVLQRRYIAPKKAIYVVSVGSRAMVVGVTDAQISHLADLSEDEMESIKAVEPAKTKQFKHHLMAFGFGIRDRD